MERATGRRQQNFLRVHQEISMQMEITGLIFLLKQPAAGLLWCGVASRRRLFFHKNLFSWRNRLVEVRTALMDVEHYK